MRFVRSFVLALMALWVLAAPAWAQQKVRVATYNIKFLNASIPEERANRIKEVIKKLDADVIGLQEIDDRAALERVFSKDDWYLVIDDKSKQKQDLAVAVRKPFKVVNLKGDPKNNQSAGDGDFLFPEKTLESEFPDRRDVLVVEVQIPQEGNKTFFVMVHHAKSRLTGRNNTEPRRMAAARMMLKALETQYDEKNFVLLGDFNDNGDDRSLNILETGDPFAAVMMEETEGPFLINLCEPLLKENRVSHGRRETDIVGGKINTVDPNSRKRNFDAHGTDINTGDILFENMLIPVHMKGNSTSPARVFDDPSGVLGGAKRASDHLPVYADFAFNADAPSKTPTTNGVKIAAMLPNPDGPDDGNEWIELRNHGKMAVDLTNWRMRDRGGNVFNLSGSLNGGELKRFPLPRGVMPLNNSGEDVSLMDGVGQILHRVSYAASQAKSGAIVSFDP